MRLAAAGLAAALAASAVAADQDPGVRQISYIVDVAYKDEFFIINGDKYEALGVCFDLDVGDRVVFIKGTPGACAVATIINLRNKQRCELFCR